jgi:hypothetical protein
VSSGLEAGDQVVSENMLLLVREFRIAQSDAKPVAKPADKPEKQVSKEPIAQSNKAPDAPTNIANPAPAASQAKP